MHINASNSQLNSRHQVNFLDTIVKVDRSKNEVYTDLYTKDTDTHNYLHYISAYPTHCKKAGPYGEFLRIRRNCHNINDFDKLANLILGDFLRSGYPKESIEKATQKARDINRQDLLRKDKPSSTTNENKRIPLILTFNPANHNMNKIINKHWHLIEKCNNGVLSGVVYDNCHDVGISSCFNVVLTSF